MKKKSLSAKKKIHNNSLLNYLKNKKINKIFILKIYLTNLKI